MNIEALIIAYGYPVVAVGTFLEGETILVMAGFAAHLGYLQLPWVITAAFVGSLLGDQFAFFLGRHYGMDYLKKKPSWESRLERVNRMTEDYRTAVILGFRFLYGLRNVIPFALGMSPISVPRFVLYNSLGALIWAVVVGTAGYLFGHAVEAVLGDLRNLEVVVVAVIAAVGGIIWSVHYARSRQVRN